MQLKKYSLCFAFCILANVSYCANLSDQLTSAFNNGKTELGIRLRYENAEQTSLQNAHATTLQTKLGFETAEFCQSKIKLELVDVAALFGQRYNPGVSDLNKPQYSTISDPRGAGITEGKLIYSGLAYNKITLGRQYISLDNQRHIGPNKLRQFPQSFDAISLENCALNLATIKYSFLTNVNTNYANGRGAESRRSLNTHVIHLDWDGAHIGKISVFSVINKDKTIRSNSHYLYGVRASNLPNNNQYSEEFNFSFEFARQKSGLKNPNHYSANYIQFDINKAIEPFAFSLGYEYLGAGFITPMGSIADFNGLAQAFSTLPARGLQDGHATISAGTANVTAYVTYHNFRLIKGPGSKKAGQEIDLGLDIELNHQFDLNIVFTKYYASNSVALSTRRFWIGLTANLL